MSAPPAGRDWLVLGAYAIDRVPDLDAVRWPIASLLGAFDDEALALLAPDLPPGHYDATSRSLLISFNTFLVSGRGRRILIDAGVGDDKERPDRPAWHRRRGDFEERLTLRRRGGRKRVLGTRAPMTLPQGLN